VTEYVLIVTSPTVICYQVTDVTHHFLSFLCRQVGKQFVWKSAHLDASWLQDVADDILKAEFSNVKVCW